MHWNIYFTLCMKTTRTRTNMEPRELCEKMIDHYCVN